MKHNRTRATLKMVILKKKKQIDTLKFWCCSSITVSQNTECTTYKGLNTRIHSKHDVATQPSVEL